MDVNQALKDFTATIQAKPQLSNEELKTKFPEFNSDESLIQAARDYAATSLSGKYKSDEELNSKFPEFFNPVPMARPQEQSFALPGVTLPSKEKIANKEDAVYGNVPGVTKFANADPITTLGMDYAMNESFGEGYEDTAVKSEAIVPVQSIYKDAEGVSIPGVITNDRDKVNSEIEELKSKAYAEGSISDKERESFIRDSINTEENVFQRNARFKRDPNAKGEYDRKIGKMNDMLSESYKYVHIAEMAEEAAKTMDYDGGFFSGLLRKTKDPNIWFAGVPKMANQAEVLAVAKKAQAGETLTNADNDMLRMYSLLAQAEAMRGENATNAFKGGAGITEMIPFIAQLYVSGGILGGGRKATEKFLTKTLTKSLEKKLAIRTADVAIKSATHLAQAGLAATVAPMTIEGTQRGLIDGKSLPEAYGEAYIDTAKEFATELSGGSLGVVGKVVSAIPGVEEMIAKGTKTGVGTFLKYMTSRLKDLGIHNPIGEWNEELDGAIFDHITGKDDISNFFNWDMQAQLMYTLLPLQGFSTAKNVYDGVQAKTKFSKADNTFTQELIKNGYTQEDITLLKDGLLEATPEDAGKQILAIVSSMDNGVVNVNMINGVQETGNGIEASINSEVEPRVQLNDKKVKIVTDFLFTAQKYAGFTHKIESRVQDFREKAEEAMQQAEAHITSNINPDTNTLMTLVINDVPRQVIKGKVAFREDGSFDKGNSDKEFYYLDENGETQVASSEAVSEVVEDIPYEEAIERAKQDVAAPIQAKFDNEQALPYKQGEIVRLQNGQVGTILGQAEGEYIFQDQQGNKTPVKQEAIVNEENIRGLQGGEIVDAIDNNGIPIQGELNLPMDLRSQGLADVGGNIVPIESIKKIAEEVPEEQIVTTTPSEDNKVSEIGSTTETAPLQDQTAPVQDQTAPVELLDNNGQLQTTAPTYPTNKKGEIDFDAMTDEQNFMYSKENYGEKEAMDDLNNVVIAVSKQVEATKKKIASATDLAKKNKLRIQLKAISERYTALLKLKEANSAPVEFKDFKGKPKATVEAKAEELAAEEAMNGVPDITTDIAENARLRGFRSVNGERVDRNPIIKVEKFTETERKFSDKEVVPVKRTLVEVESLQPSHKNGLRNNSFFITEAQPKERVDKASQEAASKIAQNINPNEITGGVTAYTGAPIVNAHGEVLQGNNRTNGLIEMYETGAISIEKYKQHLINNAADYGMTPEEVAAMKNPVAVDIAEIDDAKSIRIGQLNAADTESGGVQRIPAQQAAVSLGEDIGSLSTILYEGGTDDLSMYEALDINGRKALEYLHKKGVINNTQLQSAYDSKGNLTPEAKIDLQDITSFALFNGANDNMQQMFRAIPAKAQKAILQTIHRDAANPRGESLIDEVRGAIEAYNVLRQDELFNSNTSYERLRKLAIQLKGQTQLFNTETNLPLQKYSNFAIELAVLFKSDGQNALKSRFNDVYNALQGVGGDLFNATETLSLEQAIKKYFNNIDYVPNGQTKRTNVEQNSSESEARRTGHGGTPTSGKQSTQGVQPSERGRGITADNGAESNGTPNNGVEKPTGSEEVKSRDSIIKNLNKGVMYSLSGRKPDGSLDTNIFDVLEEDGGIIQGRDLYDGMLIIKTDEDGKVTSGKIVKVGDKWSWEMTPIGYAPTDNMHKFLSNLARNKIRKARVKERHDFNTGEVTFFEKPNEISGSSEIPNNQSEQPLENVSSGNKLPEQQIDAVISNQDINTNPTEAQKEAGNYKKGHVVIQDMDITIENPKGSVRRGVDEDGKAWEHEMNSHYGYFKGTVGKDGDHIDTFIGNNTENTQVFVIDQVNPNTGKFDESKVMLGYDNAEEAKQAYLENYDKDWKGFSAITEVGIDDFKPWLYDGKKQHKPFSEYKDTPTPTEQAEVKPTGKPTATDTQKQKVDSSKEKVDSKVGTSQKQPWEMTKEEFEGAEQKTWWLYGKTIDFNEDTNTSTVRYELKETGESGNVIASVDKKETQRSTKKKQQEIAKELHKKSIQQAISEGKQVPAEVLKDYPELEVKPEVKNEIPVSEAVVYDKEINGIKFVILAREKNKITIGANGKEYTVGKFGVVAANRPTGGYDLFDKLSGSMSGDADFVAELSKMLNIQTKIDSKMDLVYDWSEAKNKPKEDTEFIDSLTGGEYSKAKAAQPEKIEDFGEKIEGARKDQIKKYFNKINLNGLTLSKIFPKPSFKELLESGLSVKEVSAIKVAYEWAQGEKKSKRSKEHQLGSIRFYAAYAKTILSENLNIEFENDKWMFTDYGKAQIQLRSSAYEAVAKELGQDYLNLDLSKVRIQELSPEYNKRFVNKPAENEKYEVQYYASKSKRFETLEEALEEFVEQVKANTKTDEVTFKRKLNIYYDRTNPSIHYIGYQPSGKDVIKLKEGFKSSREAFDYKKENEAELQTMLERIMLANKKEKKPTVRIKYTNETARDRVGKDWRGGEDVTTEHFAKTFGFRGVEYGNWVNQKERQVFLNNTYDSLMDLAQIIGVSPKAISLDGKLALSFGSRGSGGASAHYDSNRILINLTKTKGLGALAHEWFHGLDNYFADFKTTAANMKSAVNAQFKEGTRPELQQAFKDLHNAFEGAYRQRSRMLDMGKSKIYFNLPHEIAARAFENYMLTKTNEAGQVNDFLANYVSPEDWKGQVSEYPYPLPEESKKVAEAFDNLFSIIKESETGALYEPQVQYGQENSNQEALDTIEKEYNDTPYKETKMEYGISEKGNMFGTALEKNVHHELIAKYLSTAFNGLGYTHKVDREPTISHAKSGTIYVSGGGRDIRISDHMGRGGVWAPTNDISTLSEAKDIISKTSTYDEVEAINRRNREESNRLFNERKAFQEELKSKGLMYKVTARTYQPLDKFTSNKPTITDIKVTELGMKNGEMAYKYEYIAPLDFLGTQAPNGYIDWYKEKNANVAKEPTTKYKKLPATIKINGVERPTTNSNGKPIHSTEEGISNFYEWFGDSKVTDEQGRPLVVYHGTPEGGFEAFSHETKGIRTNHSPKDVAFHFTDDKDYASSYSLEYRKIAYPILMETLGYIPDASKAPEKAMTYEVYLSLKNPMIYGYANAIDESVLNKAIENGHDGIIGKIGKTTEYVVLDPTQIKSSTGNNGSFDGEDANILHEQGLKYGVDGEQVSVAPFKYGEGGTKGIFKGEDGTLYKSLQPGVPVWKDGQGIREYLDKDTQEHEILKMLEGDKRFPKVGERVETSEGPAFEIEELEETKSLTFEEFEQVKKTIEELNSKGIYSNDWISVMRRPATNEVVINDFSSGVYDTERIGSNYYADTLFYRLEELMSKEDRKKLKDKREQEMLAFFGKTGPVTESMKRTASEGMPLFEPKQTFINFTPEEVNQETELAHGSTELQKAATAKTIEAANSLIIKDDNLRGLHPLRNGRDTQPKTGDLPYNITPAVSKRTVIKGYKEKGFVNFNGTKIEGHQDFADLWSIHRSPLIEKFHIGFLNADGIVLGSMAVTSGKSDVVMTIPTDEVIAHANKLGATQVYLLHNHPSGNPEPSTQDVNLTFTYVDDLHRAGIKVVGQVVVNHSKYSFIDAQERPGSAIQSYIDNKVEQFEYKTGEKPVLFTERESLGEGVNSKRRMFEIAYGLLSEPSYKGSIVWLTSGLEIAAYDIFPEGATKKDMIRIANAGVKKNLGVRVAFIHNGDKAFAGAWNGVPEETIDIIDTKLKKSNTNYTRVRSNKPEANTLWAHQIIGEYGAKSLDEAEESATRLDNLNVAKEMEATKTPQEIRLATGWEKGVDGLWRYEVEDGDIDLTGWKPLEYFNNKYEYNGVTPSNRLIQAFLSNYTNGREVTSRDLKPWEEIIEMGSMHGKELSDKEIEGARIFFESIFDGDVIKSNRSKSKENSTLVIQDKLGNIISKDLLIAYPQLKDIDVNLKVQSVGSSNYEYGLGVWGAYYNWSGDYGDALITLTSSAKHGIDSHGMAKLYEKDFKSALTHEIQHAIQDIEGFAKGGAPSMFTQARDNIQRLLKDISNIFDELGYEDWLIDGGEINITPSRNFNGMYSFAETQEKSRRDKMVSKLDEANKVIEENKAIFGKHNIYEDISDPELYKLLAGEVEARNSQTRMDYTPEQRRERLLSETADVAPEEQTVLMENLGVSHSEDLQDEFDNAISIRSEVVGMEEKVADLNKKLDKIGNRLVESYADDALPVKQWQELLTNNGVEIPDEMNYYMRVTMVPGRVKARKEYFDNTHRDPFVKILKDYKGAGWGYDEIATYTKLKHAPEYTAHIKKQKFESMGLSEETMGLFVSQMSMPANEVEAYWENWADEEIAKLDKSDKDYERKEQNIIKRAAKRYEDITADYAGQKAIEERIGMTAEEYISKFEDIDTDYWEKIAEKEISKIKHKKGSSMYTYEKQRIMAKANDPVAYLWDKIRGINDFALDEEVRSGARTKESAAEIKAIFENYVPLKGHRDATAETTYDYNRDTGDRFVKLVQKGKGRKSESFDPFAYMMQGAESSVRQAEKTLLNQTIKYIADRDNTGSTSVNKAWFVKVGEKDGKPEFELAPEIQFDDTDTQKTFNEKLDVFEKEMLAKQENGEAFRSGSKKLDLGMFIKPASAREHEVLVHRSGVSYVVRFNTNPRIAQSINDTNKRIYEGFYGDVLKVASAITRFKSAAVTMFRPTFIFVTNPLRDFDMVLNMSYVDEGAKFTGMFLKNFPVAIKTMVKYAAKQSDPSTNKYDAMLIDYIMQGGVTGISKLMELQQQTKSLKSDVNRAAHPAKAVKNLYESLSEVTENQTRLAVYFAAIEKGYSPTKATFMAKEASLNFDRTGTGRNGAKEMQTFKMFSKVGFQALYNVYNRGTKNPKTKLRMAEVLLAKTLLFGSLSTFGISILLNNLFGDGNDEKVIDDIAKLNPHKVNSSFSLRMPDGSFIHLPLSQELRAFNGLGTNMTLFMLDRLTATEAAIEFASSMSDLIPYNPVSEMLQYRSDNYGAALTASTFDALAPLAELEMNRNYYGGRIYKENQKPETPGYKQIRKTKSGDPYLEQYAINFAKWVDTITGGDGAVSGVNGKITNPEKWKHLMGGYTGGWFDQANYLMNLATKEEGLGPDDLIPSAIYTSEDRIQERSSRLNSDYFDAIDDFNTQKSKITNWKNAIKDNEIPVETREGYVKKLESNITERYIATDALAKIIKKYEEYLPQSEDKKEDIRTINKFKQLVVDLSDEKNSIEEVNKKTQAIFDEILQKTLKNN